MKLKKQPGDFYVEELLDMELGSKGQYFVHRLRKRKLDTMQAVMFVAQKAGVAVSDIGIAGLKDRQGVTVQYISVPGKRVKINTGGLKVELVGRSEEPVSSSCSRGNHFVITARALRSDELERMEENAKLVRDYGVPNYFGDQRFGCIRHGQGFIVRPMLAGRPGEALKWLLAGVSPYEKKGKRKIKEALQEAWGDWETCRTIGRRLGCEKTFQHLARQPGDLFGAFRTLPRTIRLMHLFAFQSYLWNQALSLFLLHRIKKEDQIKMSSELGRLIGYRILEEELAKDLFSANLQLPAGDMKLASPNIRGNLEERLASAMVKTIEQEELKPEQLSLPGRTGMNFKAEPRPIILRPTEMELSEPQPDKEHQGGFSLEVGFSLPRGSYATVVLERLGAR